VPAKRHRSWQVCLAVTHEAIERDELITALREALRARAAVPLELIQLAQHAYAGATQRFSRRFK
jgi:dienelactone hydrolase